MPSYITCCKSAKRYQHPTVDFHAKIPVSAVYEACRNCWRTSILTSGDGPLRPLAAITWSPAEAAAVTLSAGTHVGHVRGGGEGGGYLHVSRRWRRRASRLSAAMGCSSVLLVVSLTLLSGRDSDASPAPRFKGELMGKMFSFCFFVITRLVPVVLCYPSYMFMPTEIA